RPIVQQLVQSRLQSFKHGGGEPRVVTAGERPPDGGNRLGDRMVGPLLGVVKQRHFSLTWGRTTVPEIDNPSRGGRCPTMTVPCAPSWPAESRRLAGRCTATPGGRWHTTPEPTPIPAS